MRKGYGAGGEKTGEELGAVSAVSVWGGEGREGGHRVKRRAGLHGRSVPAFIFV